MRSHLFGLAVIVFAATALLVSCSDDDDGGDSTTTTAGEDATTTTTAGDDEEDATTTTGGSDGEAVGGDNICETLEEIDAVNEDVAAAVAEASDDWASAQETAALASSELAVLYEVAGEQAPPEFAEDFEALTAYSLIQAEIVAEVSSQQEFQAAIADAPEFDAGVAALGRVSVYSLEACDVALLEAG